MAHRDLKVDDMTKDVSPINFNANQNEGKLRINKINEARLKKYGCVVHDGLVYNKNGYRICGVMNQHDKPCQRIGHCPFHNTNVSDDAPHRIPIPSLGQDPNPPEDGEEEGEEGLHQLPPKKIPYKKGWTKEEHYLFLRGLASHGRGAWKQIAAIVSSRTPTQIQSHAQKYFLRQKQKMKNKRSIHDLNLSSPEMVELASRYSNQQQPSPPYGMDGMQGSFQPYSNDMASGSSGLVNRAAEPNSMGTGVMYHSFVQEPQISNNVMYSGNHQGLLYPYPGVQGVQNPVLGPEDGIDHGGYRPIASGDSRPAPYIITR
ncbi:hypothetical protein NDN08_006225 [Rhodosorus marinus]|uniref:HTH myb-type domain-containing protein n=1 Tax=Rhodosorus marinus TaxID=101924 RepID=A0AAV8UNX5_9RHOD|nr:hypothetical protein NDN08_006225 [Rhodosorus marinus]